MFAGTRLSTALPLAFIAVLFVLSYRYGITVAVVGSLLCALIFAHCMFAPTGSVYVENVVDRRSLLWMIVGTIALSYLFVPSSTEHHP